MPLPQPMAEAPPGAQRWGPVSLGRSITCWPGLAWPYVRPRRKYLAHPTARVFNRPGSAFFVSPARQHKRLFSYAFLPAHLPDLAAPP